MKKLIVGVAAGALLLTVATVALAKGPKSTVNQTSHTRSETEATSISGKNKQSGGGTLGMDTGDSYSSAMSITAGNVNVGEGGNVNQTAFTKSETEATSLSGLNMQTGGTTTCKKRCAPSQSMWTGDSGSFAGSLTVSNVNVSF